MFDQIISFLDRPFVSVCASIFSIIAAFFTFIQYRNTRKIKKELDTKLLNYAKAQLRGSLSQLIWKIIDSSNSPKKLLIGGKLNKEITQFFSEIRSGSVYGDLSVSDEIKRCEKKLSELSEGKGKVNDFKDALCDLSRAIDNSVKE